MPAEPPAAPAQPGIRLAGVGVAVADMTDQGPITRTILSDIDAHLAAPMTSVVGSNGSGKSTFCQLLNGLVPADAGTVTVDGLDPARSPRAVRERVGFVFTDPAAQLVMPTVGEDVELSLRRAEPRAAARRERALAVLDELGIADLAARSVYELSGGQRQLAALAAVLAVDPAILVLDEPTTLLDLRNREVLRALLFRLVAQRGLRIVVSTHDLALAAEADDALHFEAGRLVAHGAPAEVVAGYRAAVLGAL